MKDKLKSNILNIKIIQKQKALYVKNRTKNDCNEILNRIAAQLYTGFDIIIFDTKYPAADREIIEMTKKINSLCAEFDATFLIKGRADIAYAVEADGLILDKNDIPISAAHEITGHNSLTGFITEKEYDADIIDFIIKNNSLICKTDNKVIKITELE